MSLSNAANSASNMKMYSFLWSKKHSAYQMFPWVRVLNLLSKLSAVSFCATSCLAEWWQWLSETSENTFCC